MRLIHCPVACLLLAAGAPFVGGCQAPATNTAKTASPATSASRAPVTDCTANDLRLVIQNDQGSLNGMMHSGLYFAITNTGDQACRLPAWPTFSFLDGTGQPLSANAEQTRQAPDVANPQLIAANTSRYGLLRWVSGDAYGADNCQTAAQLRLTLPTGPVSAPVSATLCAPAHQAATFEEPPLVANPDDRP